MRSQSFAELLAASGPDKPKLPALSSEARAAKAVPASVAELLERRRLLALTINVTNGVLVIEGTSAAERIEVWRDVPSTDVKVDLNGSTVGGPYTASQIYNSKVKVLAGAGNDTVKLWNSGTWDLQYPGELYGEDGNDSMEGSLVGSIGDSMYGGYGDDTMHGKAGPDSMFGWYGYDVLDGGTDNDFIHGEEDNDTLTGGDGSDQLFGDAGNDSFIADDQYTDTLNGGPGTDCAGTRKDTGPLIFDVLQFMEG